ncbi:unnamed protein product [Ilex paraguariensis]
MHWEELNMVSDKHKNSIFKGISVLARTEMPVTKRVAINFRWGVNFPEDLGKQMPVLSVNKIGIERIHEAKEEKGVKEKSKGGDVELMKGMFLWMRRELDVLQRDNREMKHRLEEMKLGNLASDQRGGAEGVRKKALPVLENPGAFEQWRSKNSGGQENGWKEAKKNGNRVSDVESELQRAIKAASS